VIHADDETLQAYLDDALDEQATAEIERQLAASADLRQREQEMRDLLADCGYLCPRRRHVRWFERHRHTARAYRQGRRHGGGKLLREWC
jgi:anti-sigma factor RsiW